MNRRFLLAAACCLVLSGCWNGGNTHVSLGDVSIGSQLVALKTALDEGAISEDEFEETKRTLLALNTLCENTDADDWTWF